MIEEDFYATIKLKNGEEIFAKVSPSEEEGRTLLLVNNPIIFSEISSRSTYGYKVEPWLKTTTEDLIIINMDNVLTIVESSNIEMISLHQKYSRKLNSLVNGEKKTNSNTLTKEMGYISTVKDAKDRLENIFKNS